jgi:hypothetical protein
MRSLRFTLAGLMALVAVFGIVQLAILRANPLWSSLALTIATGFVVAAALAAAVMPTGPSRAGWFGAALCGGVYLSLCFIPPFATAIEPHLFTSQIAAYIHPRLNYGAESGYYLWPPYNSEEAQIWLKDRAGNERLVTASVVNWGDNRESFNRLCHSLFGLLFALGGRSLGRAIWMRSRRNDRQSPE